MNREQQLGATDGQVIAPCSAEHQKLLLVAKEAPAAPEGFPCNKFATLEKNHESFLSLNTTVREAVHSGIAAGVDPVVDRGNNTSFYGEQSPCNLRLNNSRNHSYRAAENRRQKAPALRRTEYELPFAERAELSAYMQAFTASICHGDHKICKMTKTSTKKFHDPEDHASTSLGTICISDTTQDSSNGSQGSQQQKNTREEPNDSPKVQLPLQVVDIEQPSKPIAKEEDFTNDPHPALETPLLYFMLRRSPKLLTAIQSFYNFRWDVTYPLQNRVPCSKLLRKAKIILTLSELFLLIPFFGLMIAATIYTIIHPDPWITGHVARTPLIFAFVSAMRNNILTFFLGMPVERAIKYHKIAARLAYVNGMLHTFVAFKYPATEDSSSNFFYFLFQDTVNCGGTTLMLVMTCMIITALPYIRRTMFELFYLVHIAYAVLAMACAFYHTGFLLPTLGSLTWGLDFVVRKVYMPFFRYPRKAALKRISETVLEMSFPKQDGFDFNPGQYIYVAVPELGYLEWHPFSLSSSPKQKIVTLHIRKAGGWTKALYALARKQSEVDILIEGPYGSVGVDLTNPYRYQTVMLFSGGIGVTPMQSLCNSLMYEHNHGMRKLRKLSFVWIERDPVVMPEVDVVRRESIRCLESIEDSDDDNSDMDDLEQSWGEKVGIAARHGLTGQQDADGAVALASQLLAMVPPGQETDEQMARYYPSTAFDVSEDLVGEDDALSDIPVIDKVRRTCHPPRSNKTVSFNVGNRRASWRAGEERSIDESFLNHAFESQDPKASPLDLQVYLTQKEVPRAIQRGMPPFVTIGRPDIQSLFQQARSDALRNHQPRVAVCVCAPLRIVDLCRKACAKYSDRYVTFDFHFEVFE